MSTWLTINNSWGDNLYLAIHQTRCGIDLDLLLQIIKKLRQIIFQKNYGATIDLENQRVNIGPLGYLAPDASDFEITGVWLSFPELFMVCTKDLRQQKDMRGVYEYCTKVFPIGESITSETLSQRCPWITNIVQADFLPKYKAIKYHRQKVAAPDLPSALTWALRRNDLQKCRREDYYESDVSDEFIFCYFLDVNGAKVAYIDYNGGPFFRCSKEKRTGDWDADWLQVQSQIRFLVLQNSVGELKIFEFESQW